MKINTKYKWVVLIIFFAFMLLHQTDKLLINPLAPQIYKEWNLTDTQWGAISTAALIVGAVFYPVWGYLYDRYARSKLLALASFIWGATTWISAIAPSYGLFLASRALTGVDDSSYPGLYSLIADYFEPKVRGKVFGLLQLTAPIGYTLGMLLAMILGGSLGWRSVFFITGSLGILMAVVIFFFVKEPVRGGSEPELQNVQLQHRYKFSFKTALELFKKPSMLFLFLNGFFGVLPWQVITFWIFRYLEVERGYDEGTILVTMVIAILAMSIGFPFAGWLGDQLFRKSLRGRLLVGCIGIFLGIVFAILALNTPVASRMQFGIFLVIMAFFMPFAAANVLATIYDITVPEVRSTTNALFNFAEQIGSAAAPSIAGLIAVKASLGSAILWISTIAWSVCLVMLIIGMAYVPRDILGLRKQLADRAALELAHDPEPAQ